jgi:hypothetical protein
VPQSRRSILSSHQSGSPRRSLWRCSRVDPPRSGHGWLACVAPRAWAAEHEPRDVLVELIDRLAAVTGALITHDSSRDLVAAALRTEHDLFDDALAIVPIPTARPDVDLQREVRCLARAVGALLVRLSEWACARLLAGHSGPPIVDHPRGWISTIDSNEANASGRPLNAEHWRHGIRAAAGTIERIDALRPDGASGNDPLDSVLVFELVSCLVELDRAERADIPLEIWPDFAYFRSTPLRPVTTRLPTDAETREALLPSRTAADALRLLRHLDQAARQAVVQTGFWEGLLDARIAAQVT